MPKILLVEDNEMNRDMLSRRLLKRGFEVELALDGEEGVQKAIALDPDLILLDMSLPIIDGWEAARRIREAKGNTVPIIALTAQAMSDDRNKALDAGCDEPIDAFHHQPGAAKPEATAHHVVGQRAV